MLLYNTLYGFMHMQRTFHCTFEHPILIYLFVICKKKYQVKTAIFIILSTLLEILVL